MKKLVSRSALAGLSFLSFSTPAADPDPAIVVTATRTGQTADDTLASITVITREDIERSQARSVADLLRGEPGLSIANSGGNAILTSVLLRGTESDHVLVLIDGIRAGSATAGTTAFENIPLAQIERIEIVRGGARAVDVLDRIVKQVDVLVGNEEDLQMGLGIPGPDVKAKSQLDPGAFVAMMASVARKHPQVKIVATTLREVHSTNRHSWSAVAWINGKTSVAPTCDLEVLDRVGGGDGFASGLIYGLLNGESEDEAVKLGWAHGALLTTFPGDTTMATAEQVRAFAKGGSARIQR